MDDCTAKGLTGLFMNVLNKNKIKLQDCHGQGYDNSVNMKGRKSGIQARTIVLNPRDFFMTCGCHSLVVSDAASSSLDSVSLFGVLHRGYILYSASTIRWKILNVTNLTVKPLSDTHWESCIDIIRPERYQVIEVYDSLIEFAELSKTEAETQYETSNFWSQLWFGTISLSK